MIGEAVRVAETAEEKGWISRRETLTMKKHCLSRVLCYLVMWGL